MIGQPTWFQRRKWGGWGLSPATWQGWAYIAGLVGILFGTQLLIADEKMRMIALGVVTLVVIADTIDIMARIKKDEREILHEAIAERNALWTIVFVLAGGVAYQVATGIVVGGTPSVDPVILIALLAGVVAKAISNYMLDHKD